jgi:hypothetical protein
MMMKEKNLPKYDTVVASQRGHQQNVEPRNNQEGRETTDTGQYGRPPMPEGVAGQCPCLGFCAPS